MHLKISFLISLAIIFMGCSNNRIDSISEKSEKPDNLKKSKLEIGNMLDSFNIAAANANYKEYFRFYAEDGVFIGTDATENWDKKSFMIWAKPIFDKKKAWDFTSIDRHIYFDKTGNMAWFDELLNTQMKICRGSGVVEKIGDYWKIKQYVLSMTIPNENTRQVIEIKSEIEDSLINIISNN